MGGAPKTLAPAHDKENQVLMTKMSLDEVQGTRSAQRAAERANTMQSQISVDLDQADLDEEIVTLVPRPPAKTYRVLNMQGGHATDP